MSASVALKGTLRAVTVAKGSLGMSVRPGMTTGGSRGPPPSPPSLPPPPPGGLRPFFMDHRQSWPSGSSCVCVCVWLCAWLWGVRRGKDRGAW